MFFGLGIVHSAWESSDAGQESSTNEKGFISKPQQSRPHKILFGVIRSSHGNNIPTALTGAD